MTASIPKAQPNMTQVQQANGDRAKTFASVLSGHQFIKIDPNKPLDQFQHPIEKVALKNPIWLENSKHLGLFLLRCSFPFSEVPLPLKSWNIASRKIHCSLADNGVLDTRTKALFLNLLWKGVRNLKFPDTKVVINDSRILDSLLKSCGFQETVEEVKSSEENGNGVVLVEKDHLFLRFRNRVQELLSYQTFLEELQPIGDEEGERKRVEFRDLRIQRMSRTQNEVEEERKEQIERERPDSIADGVKRVKLACLSSVCGAKMKQGHFQLLGDIFLEAAFLPVKDRLPYALNALHKKIFGETNEPKIEAFLSLLKHKGTGSRFVEATKVEDEALKELCDLEKTLIEGGIDRDKIVFDPGFANEEERELFFEIRSKDQPIVHGAADFFEPFGAIRATIELV